jgi:hypothetical protein
MQRNYVINVVIMYVAVDLEAAVVAVAAGAEEGVATKLNLVALRAKTPDNS